MGSRSMESLAAQIFKASYQAALPSVLVAQALKLTGDTLHVADSSYKLHKNVHIAAFGKASLGMVRGAENILGDHVISGVASTPVGSASSLRSGGLGSELPTASSRIECMEGAKNNLPDAAAELAAIKIEALAKSLGRQDLLLVLVSGGGSALLPAPVPQITLHEKLEAVKTLSTAGASIQELNTVRQHLSRLKGGKLARLAAPASVISLIFSDVIYNDLQFVASGPTVDCQTTARDALDIVCRFDTKNSIPKSVTTYLETAPDPENAEITDRPLNTTILIGDSQTALNGAKQFATNSFGKNR